MMRVDAELVAGAGGRVGAREEKLCGVTKL